MVWSINKSQRHSYAQNLINHGLYLSENLSFPPFIFLMHFQSSRAPKFGYVQIRIAIELQNDIKLF
jgi:hypothetical protein